MNCYGLPPAEGGWVVDLVAPVNPVISVGTTVTERDEAVILAEAAPKLLF